MKNRNTAMIKLGDKERKRVIYQAANFKKPSIKVKYEKLKIATFSVHLCLCLCPCSRLGICGKMLFAV